MPGKQLSPEIEARIQQLWPRFPEGRAGRALCLPVLYLAQEQFGHVDAEVIDLVAARLGLTAAHVTGVATFYFMINRSRPGRFHLQVCTNIGCQLMGAYDVFDHCKRRLGVANKGTTADDNITLTEVECLAACGYGPVAQIAERGQPEIPLYFEQLDRAKIDAILDALAKGQVPRELGV
ncbi:MAG: NAD(P)H-dependent oxidoreductase subunit E [Deltaproteobacteria bacterium]|nr:NAD(P)H-dependent oxidoreductase subunit E [Deltaproteobacteria bacterium]MBK8236709.1 NAD(P)H-dependent oxidoreductase subunit E [Deltaproteobacteria bacterium]MBK8720000.1 NAD(P)H-dependent oxidoreductase subunit E [Deltaproteobacteria bacterium]MBP7288715.1 NAD(P)H-dependent oxidoreductase subunit E [Nannocystaceae bacterium]